LKTAKVLGERERERKSGGGSERYYNSGRGNNEERETKCSIFCDITPFSELRSNRCFEVTFSPFSGSINKMELGSHLLSL
jgi:hypothetical protein